MDDGDAAFLTDRVARELARERLEGTFIAHDLAAGLPPLTLDGPVLVTSCCGITYRPVDRRGVFVDEVAALRFGDELQAEVPPPPVNTRLGLLEKQGRTPHAVDRSGLWGQTVRVALRP